MSDLTVSYAQAATLAEMIEYLADKLRQLDLGPEHMSQTIACDAIETQVKHLRVRMMEHTEGEQ